MRPSPRVGLAPRTMAAGRRAVLPKASSAAVAISSAVARIVLRMILPSASGVPRMSSIGLMPLTPMATSMMPQRHGRPKLSDTMTGTSTPKAARTADRMRSADASGSTGSSVTIAAALRAHVRGVDAAVGADETVRRLRDQDAVLPADDPASLAQHDLELARVAVPACREFDRLRAAARSVVRSTIAPSALETIFWVTTRTSSSRERQRLGGAADERATSRAGRSSPGPNLRDAVQGEDLDDWPAASSSRPRGRRPRMSASSRSSGVSTSKASGPSTSTYDAPAAAASRGVRRPAVLAEAERDGVGRRHQQRVRPRAVAVGHEDHHRPAGGLAARLLGRLGQARRSPRR